MVKQCVLLLLVLTISCSKKQDEKTIVDKGKTSNEKGVQIQKGPQTEIVEVFVDSLNIGDKGNSKVNIIKHRVLDNTYLIVEFYHKNFGRWIKQNNYLYETTALMDLQPKISDFNNDALNDVTIVSATAARGSNEVRRLFVYDKSKRELVSIVNSERFPNMQYNSGLNCIDAFLFHGGTSTVFARIIGDSLKKFAAVHSDNNRTVYEIDYSGKEKLIRKDTLVNPDDVFIRYKNYNPLKGYIE